jgi:predicted RNA-binding Zn ribbon-like protein
MLFAPDTESGLRNAAALVNTADPETLAAPADLARWLDDQGFTFAAAGTATELDRVRALRPRLRAVWGCAAAAPDPPGAVSALVNALLADVPATPRLAVHDGWGWHLHMTGPEHALPDRVAAEAAMALVDLVRSDELGRLRTCAAPDCDAVLVDLTRNRSKRFCDTGNCGNRQHVAAYRARRTTS